MEGKRKDIDSSAAPDPIGSSSEQDLDFDEEDLITEMDRLFDESAVFAESTYPDEGFEHVEPDVEARLRAIKSPEGRVIREGDYPSMQAAQTEDGTWVLIKREKPTTLWGRVKALLF